MYRNKKSWSIRNFQYTLYINSYIHAYQESSDVRLIDKVYTKYIQTKNRDIYVDPYIIFSTPCTQTRIYTWIKKIAHMCDYRIEASTYYTPTVLCSLDLEIICATGRVAGRIAHLLRFETFAERGGKGARFGQGGNGKRKNREEEEKRERNS